MNSTYISNIELKNALKAYQKNELLIIPVIIRPCDYDSLTALNIFHSLPNQGGLKPISRWEDRDEAWLSVVKKIKILINNFENLKTKNTPSSKLQIPIFTTIYHPIDKPHFDKLNQHIQPLVLFKKMILIDSNGEENIGTKTNLLEESIKTSDFLLFLITPNFWTTYSTDIAQHITNNKEHHIIPLKIVTESFFKDSPFNRQKTYPSDNQYVSQWNDEDNAFTDIVHHISLICDQFTTKK